MLGRRRQEVPVQQRRGTRATGPAPSPEAPYPSSDSPPQFLGMDRACTFVHSRPRHTPFPFARNVLPPLPTLCKTSVPVSPASCIACAPTGAWTSPATSMEEVVGQQPVGFLSLSRLSVPGVVCREKGYGLGGWAGCSPSREPGLGPLWPPSKASPKEKSHHTHLLARRLSSRPGVTHQHPFCGGDFSWPRGETEGQGEEVQGTQWAGSVEALPQRGSGSAVCPCVES